MGYSPRKRARSEVPRIHSWPEDGNKPRLQGFAGYKAGMTHAHVVDYRPTSTTAGREVLVPVTVLETPPMMVSAVRFYKNTLYGLKTLSEFWAPELDKTLSRRVTVPKKKVKKIPDELDVDEVRVLMYTLPKLAQGVPKKKPELMEIRIGGGTIEDRTDYAKSILGKKIPIEQYAKVGMMVDVTGTTTGKGFQGPVKRWGVKLRDHKDSKHRRIGHPKGPWHPNWVMSEVPQAGQMGYHQRTEYNKRILKIGTNGEDIVPKGGFLHYGVVKNPYLLMHGSVPGPVKRLVRLRDPLRSRGVKIEKVDLKYVSTESKQGV